MELLFDIWAVVEPVTYSAWIVVSEGAACWVELNWSEEAKREIKTSALRWGSGE